MGALAVPGEPEYSTDIVRNLSGASPAIPRTLPEMVSFYRSVREATSMFFVAGGRIPL